MYLHKNPHSISICLNRKKIEGIRPSGINQRKQITEKLYLL